MKVERTEHIVVVNIESCDSLLELGESILDIAKKSETYAIAFVIADDWKIAEDEYERTIQWIKKVPYFTISTIQSEQSGDAKLFSLNVDYRLSCIDYMEAVLEKQKMWFRGKTPEHIESILSFYRNFRDDLSEEQLLEKESYTFCDLINREQVIVE